MDAEVVTVTVTRQKGKSAPSDWRIVVWVNLCALQPPGVAGLDRSGMRRLADPHTTQTAHWPQHTLFVTMDGTPPTIASYPPSLTSLTESAAIESALVWPWNETNSGVHEISMLPEISVIWVTLPRSTCPTLTSIKSLCNKACWQFA